MSTQLLQILSASELLYGAYTHITCLESSVSGQHAPAFRQALYCIVLQCTALLSTAQHCTVALCTSGLCSSCFLLAYSLALHCRVTDACLANHHSQVILQVGSKRFLAVLMY